MTTPAYTYEPDAQPYDMLSLTGAGITKRFRARVRRSDGTIVHSGGHYRDARTAKAQAGRTAASFRAYLTQKGACWYDLDIAAKAHKKAREQLRNATAKELMDAASKGTRAAAAGAPETERPYAWDTAQGITWTQAYRLTKDRLADWAAENPEPIAP